MPILDIEIVEDAPPGGPHPPATVRVLADRIAAVLGSGPAGTWVKLHYLPRDSYAENGGDVPPGVRPTFVTVLLARHPDAPEPRRLARRIADAVAATLDRPRENVHVLFEPPAAGRIAFGGELFEG